MGLPATSMAAFNPDMCSVLLQKSDSTSTSNPSEYQATLPYTSGKLLFSYDADTVADKMEVKLDGESVLDTGCVTGASTKDIEVNYSGRTSAIISMVPICDGGASILRGTSSSSWKVSLSSCPEKTVSTIEYKALVELYDKTGGTSWNTQDGWKDNKNNKNVCNWSGIICDDEGNVTELRLPNNNLIDELPSSIGNLSRLVTLDLSSNSKLSGALPSSMGGLKNLKILNISYDNFSSLPAEVKGMANLVEFDVSNNQIATLPTAFADFVALMTKSSSTINLRGNNICYSTLDTAVLAALDKYPYDWGKESQNCNTIVESEYDALMALFTGTNGSYWSNTSGWGQNKEICSWSGVVCRGGSVAELNLSNNGLSGTLPSEVSGLKNLTLLDLRGNNKLSGSIPDSITKLTKLFPNGTYGALPLQIADTNLCVNTAQVGVFVKSKSGTELPNCAEQAALVTAQYDVLMTFFNATGGKNWTRKNGWGQNKDFCTWEGVACQNGSVTGLSLYSNGLNGKIPAEISKLTQLTNLEMGSNQLQGNIPPEISKLGSLDTLYLNQNQLEGDIAFIWNMGQLRGLSLSQNKLSISLPSNISNLKKLRTLWLGDNQLMGNIPDSIGSLTELVELGLFNGYSLKADGKPTGEGLTGTIPNSIGNLLKLERLELAGNNLSGVIPAKDIVKLSKLKILNLERNKLTGNIPSDIGNLINLTALWLGKNQLTGSIPTSIGNLTNLTRLGLEANQLTGNIPTSMFNLTNLIELGLSYNQLTGSIPTSIGNLRNLTGLWLGNNQLTGSIPTAIGNLINLTGLDLYNNQLTGSIPISIGNLKNLTGLWLGNNQLTGSIPATIGNLINLTNLDLSNNQLTGIIPDEIINLVKAGAGTLVVVNNHLCTTNSKVSDFLTSKNGGNWKQQQTNTPCDPRYSLNTSKVSFGFDHKKTATPLTLSGNLVDNSVTFTVTKTDGSAFSQNGTMYLKVGSFETYGAERARKTVKKGDLKVTFDAVDNDKFPNYPKMYFARFESSENEYHAYAGPIIISKRLSDGAVASTFNGNIVSYQNGDQLVFEYIDPENDYNGGYSWYVNYVNDDLSKVQSTSKTLSVPSPLLSSTNPVHYVALRSGANEWLYSYPQQKDTYEIASFRNYIFKTSQGKTDKAVVVSFGDQWLWVNTEKSVANNFKASLPKQITPIHKDSLTLPPVDISAFSSTPITVYEGIKNNSYQTADFPDLGLDAKSRKLVNIDPLTDFLNRKLKSTSSSLRANFPMSDFEKALAELDKSPLLPSDFTPSKITSDVKSATISSILNMMASHIGMDNTMQFLLKLEKTTDNTLDIINAIIALRELAVKMEQADQDGLSESIKGLYVLSYIFDETPLSKFLVFHRLINPITEQLAQLGKIINEKSCAFQVGKVRLSIYQDVTWWPFDRDITENIEEVQLFPLRLIYGDGVTTTPKVFSLDERKKHPVTLTKNAGVWEYPEHSVADELDFSITYPTYCGAWMVAAKAGDKMYYGRVTLRSNGNVPSAVVVAPRD